MNLEDTVVIEKPPSENSEESNANDESQTEPTTVDSADTEITGKATGDVYLT